MPVDLSDPGWEASSHKGLAIVRAPNEEAARNEAEKAFGAKTRFKPGGGVKAPPWQRSALVKAERVEDSRYETEGLAEILDPSL